jgi:4a-hydroxytetrahydrobiopterin dehydratase
MTKADAEAMLLFHVKDWVLSQDAKSISKKFEFKNFAEALAFVNKVGAIAESEGHHPDIELGWGKVNITLTTHAIGGLSQNDFIVAAKINNI